MKLIGFLVGCSLFWVGCYLEIPLPRTNPFDPKYTGTQTKSCQKDSDCTNNQVCSNQVCGPKICSTFSFQKSVPNQNFENTSDGQVLAATFHPEGGVLATGSENGTVKIWKYPGLTLERILKGHTQRVNSLDFNPTGKYLASASDDKTIIIWNTETGAQEIQLRGHTDAVTSIDFGGIKYLISGSRDATIRFWDIPNQREARTPVPVASEPVNVVARSPNGSFLAAAVEHPTTRVGKVLLWKLQDLTITPMQPDLTANAGINHNSVIYDIAWSPDSTQIATAPDSEAVAVWNITTQKRVREFIIPESEKPLHGLVGHPQALAWSRNTVHLAVSGSAGRVVIWDAQTGKHVSTLIEMAVGSMPDVAFNSIGTVLIGASTQPSLGAWHCTSP